MGFTSALGRAPSATSTARLLFLPLENFWAIRMGRTPKPRREPNDLGNKKQRLRDGQGARGAHGQSRAAIGYHAPGASLAAAYHGREGSRARLGTLGTEDVQATYPSFWGFGFFFPPPTPCTGPLAAGETHADTKPLCEGPPPSGAPKCHKGWLLRHPTGCCHPPPSLSPPVPFSSKS